MNIAFATTAGGLPLRRAGKNRCNAVRMVVGAYVSDGIEADDYVTLGVATCFRRVDNKLNEVLIVEPLPSSAVDCIARLGVPTSYRRLMGARVGDISDVIAELPKGLIEEGENVAFAEKFGERVHAAARTFRRAPHLCELVDVGSIMSEINHSTERKRMLDENWEPSFDDNVKQHMSIDVYNREAEATNVTDLYNA